MHYRQRGEHPCEAVITINGVAFKCPRAGYVPIQHKLFCAYCADVFKCDEIVK